MTLTLTLILPVPLAVVAVLSALLLRATSHKRLLFIVNLALQHACQVSLHCIPVPRSGTNTTVVVAVIVAAAAVVVVVVVVVAVVVVAFDGVEASARFKPAVVSVASAADSGDGGSGGGEVVVVGAAVSVSAGAASTRHPGLSPHGCRMPCFTFAKLHRWPLLLRLSVLLLLHVLLTVMLLILVITVSMTTTTTKTLHANTC